MIVLISDLADLADYVCELDDRKTPPADALLQRITEKLNKIATPAPQGIIWVTQETAKEIAANNIHKVDVARDDIKRLISAFGLVIEHKNEPPKITTTGYLHDLIIQMASEYADEIYAPEDEAA